MTDRRDSVLWQWLSGVASAYLVAMWGSLVVILLSVGSVPTLDATRPGAALLALVLVSAGASFLGRGSAGITGAVAGTASAYALAIITTLRAAERNWAFIAPGPATAWQTGVTETLVRSLLVLVAAAVIGALGRELLERGRRTSSGSTPSQPHRLAGFVVAVVTCFAALGGTVALVAAAAETAIVLPVQVPTITAMGRGAQVTVAPATVSPGEARIVTDSDSAASCAACAGGIEFFGPLSDAEVASLRVGTVVDEAIERLPRPAQLWYGGVSLAEGRYVFAHTLVTGPDDPFRLIGLGILTVSEGPTPPVVARTPGDAPLFVGVQAVILALHGACVGVVVFGRRRVARLSETGRWTATIGVAVVASLVLAALLGFYVSFAGSPF
jgi:hypothetical protein